MRWLFWDVDARALRPGRDRAYVLPRILEHGGIVEVRWAIATYGMDGIHAFLRDVGHPELSPRTLAFWRAALHAGDEAWASEAPFRRLSAAPWVA
jgi:hypothetical protein